MAKVTTKLTLSSTDLLSQSLNLSLSKTITAAHTTGLARAPITSTALGTTAGQVTIYTSDDYAATAYVYIKNTDTTATDYIYVYGDTPVVTASGGAFNNDPTVTHVAVAGIQVGMVVSGDGIPEGATVASITSTTVFELSASTTGGSLTGKALVFSYGKPTNLKLGGGEFAFMPVTADKTMKAYATTTGTVVEFMVFGTDQ